MILRPEPPKGFPSTINFQLVDIYIQDIEPCLCDISNRTYNSNFYSDLIYIFDERGRLVKHEIKPISHSVLVFLFGVTDNGNSISICVREWKPWLFIECEDIFYVINQLSLKHIRYEQTTIDKMHMYGYEPGVNPLQTKKFSQLKLSFPSIAEYHRAKKLLEDPIMSEYVILHDHKIQMQAMFCAELGIDPSGWCSIEGLDRNNYHDIMNRYTWRQIELEVSYKYIKPSLQQDTIASFIIAAWDIETYNAENHFPNPLNDPCICIGMSFWIYGTTTKTSMNHHVVLCLSDHNETTVYMDHKIVFFSSEIDLLNYFHYVLFIQYDIDILAGYNTSKFDVEYLVKRLTHGSKERASNDFSEFWFMSHICSQICSTVSIMLCNSASGDNKGLDFSTIGIINIDLFYFIKTSYKLGNYRLDSVALNFDKNAGTKLKLKCETFDQDCRDIFIAKCDEFINKLSKCSGSELWQNELDQLQREARFVYDTEKPKNISETCYDDQSIDSNDEVIEDNAMRSFSLSAFENNLYQISMRVNQTISGHYNDFIDYKAFMIEIGLLDEYPMWTVALRSYLGIDYQNLSASLGDNNYHKMFALYRFGRSGRLCNAIYCAVDCDLVLNIMESIAIIPFMKEMSSISSTLMKDILSRGQQIKLVNTLYRECYNTGYVMNKPVTLWKSKDIPYVGATVLEPQDGFYVYPVVTLDFASLYPSIMQAYNLCPSTLIIEKNNHIEDQMLQHQTILESRSELIDLDRCIENGKQCGNLFDIFPDISQPYGRVVESHNISGFKFSFVQHVKSVTSKLLETFGKRRKEAQKLMKDMSDPLLKMVADKRQSSLKILMNSFYGFYGIKDEETASYPCLMVSVVVTMIGRQMIEFTRRYVEQDTLQHRIVSRKLNVIYGDTDSVMIEFDRYILKDVFEIAKVIQNGINDLLRRPMKINFEKVSYPFILIGKKRYCALKYEPTDNLELLVSKRDCKGLDIVRRDRACFLRDCEEHLIDLMMNPFSQHNDQPIEVIIEMIFITIYDFLKGFLTSIVNNKLAVQDYIKSKTRNAHYLNPMNQLHLNVVRENAKRGSMKQYAIGDRVDFVHVTPRQSGGSCCKNTIQLPKRYMNSTMNAFEHTEDPDFAIMMNIPIDRLYYINHEMFNSVMTLLNPICKLDNAPNYIGLFAWAEQNIYLQQDNLNTLGYFLTKTKETLISCPTLNDLKNRVPKRKFIDTLTQTNIKNYFK